MTRRLLITAALVLLLLVGTTSALAGGGNDGTLVVRSGTGDTNVPVVGLVMRGAIIGQLDSGRIVIDDPNPNDGPGPTVTGAERTRDLTDTATLYRGSDIRFRAVGGRYIIRIYGRGIDVNAVGQGKVWLQGSPFVVNHGRYSINGASFQTLPDFGDWFVLNANS